MLLPRVFMNSFMDDDMRDFFNDRPLVRNTDSGWMKTDVIEKENQYELDMNLPGFAKENVKISLNDGYLTVSAATSNENTENNTEGRVIRRERFQGSCQRSFYVGEYVKKEDIKAKFENGVLHLTVPKNVPVKEEPVEQFIEIE